MGLRFVRLLILLMCSAAAAIMVRPYFVESPFLEEKGKTGNSINVDELNVERINLVPKKSFR